MIDSKLIKFISQCLNDSNSSSTWCYVILCFNFFFKFCDIWQFEHFWRNFCMFFFMIDHHAFVCKTFNKFEFLKYLNSQCICFIRLHWKDFFKKSALTSLYKCVKTVFFLFNSLRQKFFALFFTTFFNFLFVRSLCVCRKCFIANNQFFFEHLFKTANCNVLWAILADSFLMKSDCWLIVSDMTVSELFWYLINRLYFWNLNIQCASLLNDVLVVWRYCKLS